MNILKALIRWLYRDSGTGRFMSKADFDKRDRKTTQRERVIPHDKLAKKIDQFKDEGDTL